MPPNPDTARYLAGLDPNARVKPGLLSNPLARTNWRTVGHRKLSALLPDRAAAIETPSIGALEGALETLLLGHAVNVLVLNGGDGTIHHTLNAAIRVTDRHAIPMPLFLFVNGGGMNMLARVFGTRGHPVRTLERFLVDARGGRFGTLPKRGVPLLATREPPELGGALRYGTIFGSELVFNALTMYERFGQGYPGLARFLLEVAAGYTLRTEMWNRFGHLLDAPTTPLVIGQEAFPSYTSVVATTVPLQLVKGAIATIRTMASPGGMNVVGVLPTDKGEVIKLIAPLGIGVKAKGLVYRRDVERVCVHGAYTLDGERFDRHQGDPQAPLEVVGTRRIVWGVWL